MLSRAYRLTDKAGAAALKGSAAAIYALLSGITLVTGGVRRVLSVGVKAIVTLMLGVAGVVWFVVSRIVKLLWLVVSGVGRLARSASARLTGQTGVQGGVMARRAARAELRAVVAEDPLRAQNRLLSLMTVALLAVLIGVVWWATSSATPAPSPLIVDPDSLNINLLATPGAAATIPAALPATPVPTVTPLPAVLEARGSLAFTVRERGQTDIWAVNIGSRAPIRIVSSPADDRDPVWSPDGRRLAFASRQDGNWEIYVYDLVTGATTRMTYDLSFQGGPRWSPDGQWLVYESYQGGNLDIYVVPVDGSQPAQRVTEHPAPDFSPAWSPDGRRIAFVSLRDGNQDIYLFSLDNPSDDAVVNLTNTPPRQEDYIAWSPDGRFLAYSALDEGVEKVFVRSSVDLQAPAQVLERGRMPAWSPDGASLVFAVDSLESTQLVASPFTDVGVATLIVPVPLGTTRPTWSGAPLPPALVNSGGVPAAVTGSLFIEQENRPDAEGLYKLGQLVGVKAPSPYLSERVNDSFNALRESALKALGWDFLGELEDAFWQINRPPQPGEERRNWYMTGRQFGVNRNLIVGFPARMEIVREDIGVDVYWRLYVRVADDAQSGQLGEPLRRIPWDMLSRSQGDVEAYDQGGRLKAEVPGGYYVDFTELAADYGWQRVPAGSDWRANFNSANYWLFRKSGGLTWYAAMRELYTDGQLGGFAPTPAPPATQTQP